MRWSGEPRKRSAPPLHSDSVAFGGVAGRIGDVGVAVQIDVCCRARAAKVYADIVCTDLCDDVLMLKEVKEH